MAEQAQRQQTSAGKPPKASGMVFTLTFTLPKLFFTLLFGLVSIIWIFIFGIILGRGHNPENAVPRLAKAMPSPLAKDAGIAPPPPASVIPPADFPYHSTLKGRPAPGGAAQDAADTLPPASPGTEKKEQPKQTVKQDAAANKTVRETARNTPPALPPDSSDYVYQVAAFKSGPPAEALQTKLQAAGMKTTIEKQQVGAVTWHKLLISFRGRQEDVQTVKDALAKQGITHILLRSKKPLP